jgi:hypothetical protein
MHQGLDVKTHDEMARSKILELESTLTEDPLIKKLEIGKNIGKGLNSIEPLLEQLV